MVVDDICCTYIDSVEHFSDPDLKTKQLQVEIDLTYLIKNRVWVIQPSYTLFRKLFPFPGRLFIYIYIFNMLQMM